MTEQRFGPAVGVDSVEGPANQQGDAADNRPPFRHVVVLVRLVIVANDIAGMMRVRGEPGRFNRGKDRGSGNFFGIKRDVDAPADEIEVQRFDAGLRERMTDQRRFIGAIHAGDMEP